MNKSGTILLTFLFLALTQGQSEFCPYNITKPGTCRDDLKSKCEWIVHSDLGPYDLAKDCTCHSLPNYQQKCSCSVNCDSITRRGYEYCPYTLDLPGKCGADGSSDCHNVIMERLGSYSMAKDCTCNDSKGQNTQHRCSSWVNCRALPKPPVA